MSRPGRKPQGAELVTDMDGSETARARLQQIVRALAGQTSVPEACAALDIGESRFHQLREEALQGALAALEPRPSGRPARPAEPGAARIAALEQELRERERELQAYRIRLELAEALPGLRRSDATVKKTTPPARRPRTTPSSEPQPPSPSPSKEVPPCRPPA